MSVIYGALSADEQLRLEICSHDPIRTPGAVQSHGVLLAVDPITFEIRHASQNCGRLLGFEPIELLGRSAEFVLGENGRTHLDQVLSLDSSEANPFTLVLAGKVFDVIVQRTLDLLLIEFEPAASASGLPPVSALYSATRSLAKAANSAELWAATATTLRRLTGYDRVMVYHFHPDDHGEVVAEDADPAMEPYLGLHYPASDIPAQARELYLTKLSRIIVDSSKPGSALVSSSEDLDRSSAGPALDLSQAELRSVSVHHLEFMRNMRQAATLSFSLIYEGQLIGMVTCAHRSPRHIPFALREGLEVLTSQVAFQLGSMAAILRLEDKAELRSIRLQILSQVTTSSKLADALLHEPVSVLDLIPAEGAVLFVGGSMGTVGAVPPPAALMAIAAEAHSTGSLQPFVTRALAFEHPQLAVLAPDVAGVLLVPFGADGDFLAWFRPEISRSVNWLGDQSAANRASTLSPRTSFSSWTESVTDSAEPWQLFEPEALLLARDLDATLLRLAESELATFALRDPLTGLPNRRLLMERLEHALTKYARGEELALLFVDVDGFKKINDSLGHVVGDALLKSIGERIFNCARAQDTVARLGGDEFVVLCENTTAEEGAILAERIVKALRLPAVLLGHTISVTASVGISSANLSFSAAELLGEADAAMYRAKARGRNQTSH